MCIRDRPDGPKVGSVSLSPRGDWRMPSDAWATAWLDEIDRLDDSADRPQPAAAQAGSRNRKNERR